MLSGLAFRNVSPAHSSDEEEKRPKDKSKRKHKSKKKSHKKKEGKEHGSPEPRRSDSPRLYAERVATDGADPEPEKAPEEPHAADLNALFSRVSDLPRQKQEKDVRDPVKQKDPLPQATRIDQEAAGGGNGRVGDGGSGWRRRLQMRQSGQQGELVLNRDKREQSHGQGQKYIPRSHNSEKSGMRRPQAHASHAFRKPKGRNGDIDKSRDLNEQPEHKDSTGRRRPADFTDVPPDSRSSRRDMAATTQPDQPRAAASTTQGNANLSAAAQLKARLRGVPAAELATPQTDQGARQRAPLNAGPSFSDHRKDCKLTTEDEEQLSVAALAKSTRLGHGMDDIDKNFARNITSKRKFKMQDIDPDDEHDFGVGTDLYTTQAKKKRPETQPKKHAPPREMHDYVASKCNLCFMSDKRNKENTLSVGDLAYLALPARGSLAAGHCQIIPVDHVGSMRAAASEVAEEVKNFKKCLIQMFQAQEKRCIFMETAMNVKDNRSHACVECVPVSREAFSSAPMVLRREIDGAESEWSQHHAKRLIETTDRGLNSCIPVHFPYFHVEFGYKKGYVHVIDDVESWDRRFGRSILASLSGADTVEIYRHAQRDSTSERTRRKENFLETWREFDWTQQLEQDAQPE